MTPFLTTLTTQDIVPYVIVLSHMVPDLLDSVLAYPNRGCNGPYTVAKEDEQSHLLVGSFPVRVLKVSPWRHRKDIELLEDVQWKLKYRISYHLSSQGYGE